MRSLERPEFLQRAGKAGVEANWAGSSPGKCPEEHGLQRQEKLRLLRPEKLRLSLLKKLRLLRPEKLRLSLLKKLRLSFPELLRLLLTAVFFAWFFYRSYLAVVPMLFPAGIFLRWDRRARGRLQDRSLRNQFGECLLSVENAVKAGYAAENAFLESMKDMEQMYGRESGIMRELLLVKGGLLNHVAIERLLFEMGQRTGLEEIREFAEVFAITKRNGGQLAVIMHMSADRIGSRLRAEDEMQTLLASRRLEQKIMNLMPFGLVLYLQFTTPGYFDMFFGNLSGAAMMTGFLGWYMGACGLSEHLLGQTE